MITSKTFVYISHDISPIPYKSNVFVVARGRPGQISSDIHYNSSVVTCINFFITYLIPVLDSTRGLESYSLKDPIHSKLT
jgi:hypothetical protein